MKIDIHEEFILQLRFLTKNPLTYRFLVAASSGLDSSVLLDLCHSHNLQIGICHCNYRLRGKESDDDQKLLKQKADAYNVPIYTLVKDAKKYGKIHKLSTQEAAREIRYDWFSHCIKKQKFDFILTAHHFDDSIETFFINAMRGTGINGLKGIPKSRDHILRPLLSFSRDEILQYAQTHSISWREDNSNTTDNYLRNNIRHHIIPFFQERNDNFHKRFQHTFDVLNHQNTLLEDYKSSIFEKLARVTGDSIQFDIEYLKSISNFKIVLAEILSDYGFKDWKAAYHLIDAEVGKNIFSPSHKLVKERGFIELSPIQTKKHKPIEIESDTLPLLINFPVGKLEFYESDLDISKSQNVAEIDKECIKYPLMLRPYEKGDYFYPLGMKGRRKLSDFLKDEKLSNHQKSKVWVLTSNGEIVWVINHRIDNRYKITKTTKQCLKIRFTEF